MGKNVDLKQMNIHSTEWRELFVVSEHNEGIVFKLPKQNAPKYVLAT